MTGKEKCELLKAIRKNIADMNGIEYYPEQCEHKGDCPGFCPRCDQEADFLMRELKKKEAAGSPIRIDTESIMSFEELVNNPANQHVDYSDVYADDMCGCFPSPETSIVGNIEYPRDKEIEMLQGDVEAPSGIDCEEDVPGFLLLEEKKEDIDAMCHGCVRYNTIADTDNGIRCSCLSEHFFLNMLKKKECTLKKIGK